jgi:hypothetical protein
MNSPNHRRLGKNWSHSAGIRPNWPITQPRRAGLQEGNQILDFQNLTVPPSSPLCFGRFFFLNFTNFFQIYQKSMGSPWSEFSVLAELQTLLDPDLGARYHLIPDPEHAVIDLKHVARRPRARSMLSLTSSTSLPPSTSSPSSSTSPPSLSTSTPPPSVYLPSAPLPLYLDPLMPCESCSIGLGLE